MPTATATCPYCRTAGVPAPLGDACAVCPKCRGRFTRPATPPAEPEPDPGPAPGPAAPTDLGLAVALGALILVGPAVLATQLPYGRVVAAVFAGVGLVGGLLALRAEGRARLAGGAAVALHAALLVVALLLPSWLGLDPWRGPAPPPGGPPGPQAVSHADQALTPADWVDSASASWQHGDVRVSVRSAAVGPVELPPVGGRRVVTQERYFHLHLRVKNVGVERTVPLAGWAAGAGPDGVRVTHPDGRPLDPVPPARDRRPDRGKPVGHVSPGESSDVRLLFAAPSAGAEYLRVQLSGAALGLPDETVKFRIDGRALARTPGP